MCNDIIDLKSKFKNFNLTRVISSYKYLIANFNSDKYTEKLALYEQFKNDLIFYKQRLSKIVDDYNRRNQKRKLTWKQLMKLTQN